MDTDVRVIIGAGGHGKVIFDICRQLGLKVDYFVDQAKTETLYDTPIITEETLESFLAEGKRVKGVIAIGNPDIRKGVEKRLSIDFETLVHPKASIAMDVSLGIGTVVMAGAVINPGTVIGRHCIINTGAIVEHDNRLGDFVHMAPRSCTAGNVTVEDEVHIGLGAGVIEGINIGKRAFIGAGAAVIDDVFEHQTVVGVPARPMQRLRGF